MDDDHTLNRVIHDVYWLGRLRSGDEHAIRMLYAAYVILIGITHLDAPFRLKDEASESLSRELFEQK